MAVYGEAARITELYLHLFVGSDEHRHLESPSCDMAVLIIGYLSLYLLCFDSVSDSIEARATEGAARYATLDDSDDDDDDDGGGEFLQH